MGNNTVFYFQLTMFMDTGLYKYPAFLCCLMLYAFIVFANLVIIVVTVREKTLHAPMYILIGCLSVNTLYGSSGFFPKLLQDLLSETHLISHLACFTQIYVIYSYASNEVTILGVMAYDRYIAVCQPLHYHSIMNSKTVLKLLIVAVVWPAIAVSVCVSLAGILPLCGNKINKLYCANWNVVKLSCTPPVLNNLVGMFFAVTTTFLPFCFVLYTYLRIVIVCLRSSSEYKGKVFHSCLPHVISFVVYSISVFSDVTLSRSNIEEMNPALAIFLSLEFVVIPPVLNPLVYGLKLPEIRRQIQRLLANAVFCHKSHRRIHTLRLSVG